MNRYSGSTMRTFLAAAFAILAGCGTPSTPAPAPLTTEDRAGLAKRLRAAIESPYVLGRFYAEYETEGKVRTSCRGISRAYRTGVVFIEEEPASGSPTMLLRVGGRTWVFDEGWRDAAGTRWAGLGTGFQNPYEVLSTLEAAAETFQPHRQGGMACAGPGAEAALRPLVERAGAGPPAGAPVDGVLKSGFRDGSLVTRFSAESGRSVWIAKMDIVSWGPAPPMRFDDIPAPFTPDMKAAVSKALQEK